MKNLINRRYRCQQIAFILLGLIVIINSINIVHADMGPYSTITINVINAPESEYAIDLLRKKSEAEDISEIVNNKNKKEYSDTEFKMLSTLAEYYVDGWSAKLNRDDNGSLDISSSSFHLNDDTYKYKFNNKLDIKNFKVIIVTASGDIYISDEIERLKFNAEFTYDVQTGEIQELVDEGIKNSIKAVVVCLIATLIIEGILLLMFGLMNRRNIIFFLIINLITQLALNIYIQCYDFFRGGGLNLYIGVFFAEIVITIVEMLLYIFVLKTKNGERCKLRNAMYGITANVSSYLIGVYIWEYLEKIFSL